MWTLLKEGFPDCSQEDYIDVMEQHSAPFSLTPWDPIDKDYFSMESFAQRVSEHEENDVQLRLVLEKELERRGERHFVEELAIEQVLGFAETAPDSSGLITDANFTGSSFAPIISSATGENSHMCSLPTFPALQSSFNRSATGPLASCGTVQNVIMESNPVPNFTPIFNATQKEPTVWRPEKLFTTCLREPAYPSTIFIDYGNHPF